MTDELEKPLGRKKFSLNFKRPNIDYGDLPWGRMMAGASLLLIGGAVGAILFINDPSGGRPSVTVPISSLQDTNPIALDVTDSTAEPTINSDDAVLIVEDLVPAPAQSDALANVPDLVENRPLDDFEVFIDLLEEAKYGNIPRINAQGITPFEAYARPSLTPASANGRTLIAIVITGMGINEATTVDAIERLPENVTMAFAPYGDTLERSTLLARRQGHEVLLEVPMEPFDYPQSDPGPNTLLTNQPARTNLDHLYWLMSRFGGYIGIVNNLGARFSSSAADFTPIMEELGTRGLAYLDDNSSNRSLSRQLASANQVPFARANRALDSNPSRAAILAALSALEEEAASSGAGVGIISALPVSISTITSWAADLEDRNVVLVPISALMAKE